MPGGDDVLFPYLNAYLLGKQSDVPDAKLLKILRADYHGVPAGQNELSASQNLFWLDAAAERLRLPDSTPYNTDQQLTTRLKRERNVIGLWGSEQTSPIYHRFIITGAGVVYLETDSAELKELIKDNLASFFAYAKLMGVGESVFGLIGQRGTGHNLSEHGTPALHFVMQYHLNGRPEQYKKLTGWKNYFRDHGWVMASLRGGMLYELMKDVFELVMDPAHRPWGLMVPTHFLEMNGLYIGHYMEYGTNGNTPEVGGFFPRPKVLHSVHDVYGYLPHNERVRIRQRKTDGKYTRSIGPDHVMVTYSGLYTGLDGGGAHDNVKVYSTLPTMHLRERVATLTGLSDWRIISSQSVPQPPTPPTVPPVVEPPTDTQSWYEKLIAKIRGWL